ncbi:FdtA/QdtA family cupin domain-containing protein [Clostridium sp. DJ247]|uniref:sugar 3,4-ketoisomerase n=1 Tax=Clostridium sp. DJ247 TaxID=2726188 RepID=UPI00162A1BE4|nr:FdtA/QdtA family cupin domain-containing protein [Clostridium sp. DJ247]MBC2580268.1 WxcM-like domain-containing protein [Clostridium sp. DJ247]
MKTVMYTFDEIFDNRGVLVAIEQIKNIPFDIRRIYYMYNVDKNISRGFHAHKTLEQVLICINGRCKILLDNGREKETLVLDKKNLGLHIGPGIWREMFQFSKDAILLVLASDYYDENDYIRNYEEFLKFVCKQGEKI